MRLKLTVCGQVVGELVSDNTWYLPKINTKSVVDVPLISAAAKY